MWSTIVAALAAFFDKTLPKILDYLNMKKILGKAKSDKEERAEDIKHVEEIEKEFDNIVEDGEIDDINDKLGWDE